MRPAPSTLARNNLDLVRFCLAMTVCLVHASVLSGQHSLSFIQRVLSAEVAVQGFFAVSGFLIFKSYERSSSLKSYLGNRARRIAPAYAVVIVFSAIVLRAVSTADAFYFTHDWWAYLAANLSYLNFLQPELPGVFQGNFYRAVNGALWTLKVEIAFYLTVPAFVWAIRRAGAVPVLLAAYTLSSIYAAHVDAPLQQQLPGQLRYFLAGAACHYGWSFLQRHWKPVAGLAAAVLLAGKFMPLSLLTPAALGVLIVCAGMFWHIADVGRHGDFSYGIYLLHFPIIQALVQQGAFARSPWMGLSQAVVLTLVGAVAMWYGIERRFLHRDARAFDSKDAERRFIIAP